MTLQQPIILGVMGFSSQNFDRKQAEDILYDVLCCLPFNSKVVSGLTNLGIPGLAYRIAKELSLPTVGIACNKANDFECFPCDERIIVGDKWGDESSTFIDYCDEFIRIGGGKQSLHETSLARAKGKLVIEYNLPVITTLN